MKKNIVLTVALKILVFILLIVSLFFIEDVFAAKATADDGIEKAYGQTQFLKLVYEKMLLREEQITIKYVGDDYLDIFESFENETFLEKVSAIDDPEISDDFDYLGSNLSYMKTGIKYSKASEAVFNIEIKWRESYDEMQYVNKRIDELVEELGLSNMNTYQKVKTVHDYLVQNIEYDVSLKDENAFKALSEGSATCQGYSLLFYKIMTEVGVKCRYITGTGVTDDESGPHGWNIVKIGDYWYNIDVTWDDPVYVNGGTNGGGKISYDFFLKGLSDSFEKTHIRDEKYLTGEFLALYPVSNTNFDTSSYTGYDVPEESTPLTWDLSNDTSNIKEKQYKEVNFSDVTTYVNIVPNLLLGFDNYVSEEGLLGTVVDMWRNMTLVSRTIIIALIIVIILNSILKSLKKEQENGNDE